VAFSQFLSAPNSFPAGWTPLGELTALPRPSSWFKGKEREEEGRGRKGRRRDPPNANSWISPWGLPCIVIVFYVYKLEN